MDFFTVEMLWGLLAIILIDLVLAGDNAILIAMAASNLPLQHQKKAIYWGTFGAIIIRVIATFLVCQLLRIPALMFIGGLMLVWIAYNLLTDMKKEHKTVAAETSLGAAVRTIIVADGVMGIDNVMGIAGTAQGNMVLVIIGLFISVPLVVWGSQLLLKAINRYPVIIYIGGGVLSWSAGAMLISEPLLADAIKSLPLLKLLVPAVIMVLVVATGWWANKRAAH